MSHQQKIKAGIRKDQQQEWRRESKKRLIDKLREGRLPDINPEYQKMMANELEPPEREPYEVPPEFQHPPAEPESRGPVMGIDPVTGLECLITPIEGLQPVRIETEEMHQFETPFGPMAQMVDLATDQDASLGATMAGIFGSTKEDMLEDSREAREEQRKRAHKEQNIPAFYDSSYVDSYAEKGHKMRVPSAMMQQHFEQTMNGLFGVSPNTTGVPIPNNQQTEDPNQEVFDVSSADRRPETVGEGFVHPLDTPCFLRLHASVVRQLLYREAWFRVYYQWSVPLWNAHVMLTDINIGLKNFVAQNLAHGGFLHSWLVYEDTNQMEGRLVIKFNNYSDDQQEQLLQRQSEESMYQKPNAIGGYIMDFGCCTYILRGLDPLPKAKAAVDKSSARIQLIEMEFGFM